MGKLAAVREAVRAGQLPYIEHHTDFGWNLAGDHHSFWNPLNLSVLLVSPQTVMVLNEIFFLVLGAAGAFLFLRKTTADTPMAFMGAFTYVSLPYLIGLFYYEQSSYIFYALPFYLVILLGLAEEPTTSGRLLLFLYSALAIGAGDIYSLLILPVVGFLFTFGASHQYYGKRFTDSLANASLVSSLSLLSGAFYLVPVYVNLKTIGDATASIRAAGIAVPSVSINFLHFFRAYGYDSLFTPFEGSALLLYIPRFFYIAIAIALALSRHIFGSRAREQVTLVATLLALGATMILISVVFYHPLTLRLVPSLRGAARGVLRYHINLIPFVNLLAGSVCLTAIARSSQKRVRIGGLALVVGISFLLDLVRFARAAGSIEPFFTSSNRIQLPVGNALYALPWLNASLVLLIIAYAQARQSASGRRHPTLWGSTFVVFAAALGLVNISLHNQILAESPHRTLTRSPYRMVNFLTRNACLSRLVASDPNFRILYAGKGNISSSHGRDWKFIAETELHVEDGKKVLFPYREFVHPYVGLLRGALDEAPSFWPSNIWPPLSSQIPKNISLLRLMGVRYVVSADQPIDHADLIPRGQCSSGRGEVRALTWSQNGLTAFDPSLLENGIVDDRAFRTDSSGPGAYLMADAGVGRKREFVGLILHVGPRSPVNATWDAQYSDDGFEWMTVYRGIGGHPFGPGRFIYTWSHAGPHRNWRLLKTDAAAAGDYHGEVQFFEPYGPAFSKYYSEDGTFYVYELAEPTGIAFLTDTYRPAGEAQSLKMIYDKVPYPWIQGPALLDDPRSTEGAGADDSSDKLSTAPPSEDLETDARIVHETYNKVVVHVATPERRVVVLSYVYTPYWRAYIDGSEVPVRRVYGGFMGVIVPPGRHTVQYTYRPVDVYLGVGLWMAALAALIVGVVAAKGGTSRPNA